MKDRQARIQHGPSSREAAVEPDVATSTPDLLVTDKDRSFWAFQPPRPVDIPPTHQADRVRNPIDAFVVQKLREKKIPLSPETDRLVLLRRASFDLTHEGAPPPGRLPTDTTSRLTLVYSF